MISDYAKNITKNLKNFKKLLAFSKKLLYNITCVKETQKQNKENARLAQLVEHLTLNLERKTSKSALEEKRHCFQRDWKQFFCVQIQKEQHFFCSNEKKADGTREKSFDAKSVANPSREK
ncbi:hypothetical protein DW667_04745 [Coprococcus sp. AM25-15LB]|nr:hypothetical protein DW667_04745 [Coprococcus sp. AM25-15LB]RJW08250.1 hypothetical protein DW686_06870 [Coprococcus sp. AM25-4LB]